MNIIPLRTEIERKTRNTYEPATLLSKGTIKSGWSRVVSPDAGTVDILRAHRQCRLADKLKLGKSSRGADKEADGYVFATGQATPSTPRPSPPS